jgi:hypothetical protein
LISFGTPTSIATPSLCLSARLPELPWMPGS